MFFTSCGLSPFEEDRGSVKTEKTKIEEGSSLFTSDEENKVFTFETNDTKYLGADGYTLWTVLNVNTGESFNPLCVEMTKESGRSEAGYGIVFCSQELEGKPFMLTVLINANGYYTIGKVMDGVFSHINDGWKNSDYIFRGIGARNTLMVTYDSSSKNFMLKINGYKMTSFTVSENLAFKNAGNGFAVVIANNESFPEKSVRVIFENK